MNRIKFLSIGIVNISKLANNIVPATIKIRYIELDDSCKLPNDVFSEFDIQIALYPPPEINANQNSNKEILKT